MIDIKAGDVVSIKSGGPRMVVLWAPGDEDETDLVNVQWFREESGEFCDDRISMIALVKCVD